MQKLKEEGGSVFLPEEEARRGESCTEAIVKLSTANAKR